MINRKQNYHQEYTPNGQRILEQIGEEDLGGTQTSQMDTQLKFIKARLNEIEII